MKAVILAGGLGSRLKPFTDIIPKPLLPVGQSSVIEIQIKQLAQYGFTDIYLATNYKADFIEAILGDGSKYGVKITYSREAEPLGTCGPLKLIQDIVDSDFFLVVNGDILTQLDFKEFFQFALEKKAILTVGTKVITTPFRFGCIEVSKEGFIERIDEKPDLSFEVLAGVYVYRSEALKLIPDRKCYGVDQLIQDLLAKKKPIARQKILDYWLDIGQIEDYEKARVSTNHWFDE